MRFIQGQVHCVDVRGSPASLQSVMPHMEEQWAVTVVGKVATSCFHVCEWAGGEFFIPMALSFMFNRGAIISGRAEERRDGYLMTTRPTDVIDVFNNLWLPFYCPPGFVVIKPYYDDHLCHRLPHLARRQSKRSE